MMNKLLSISDLSVSYNGDPVLENVSLEVSQGDFIGIIGPNGGGKTTLFKVMLGLLKPTSGLVSFDNDLDITDIGYLPQMPESDITFPLSVTDVVLSGLMHKKRSSARMGIEDVKRARNVIEDLGLNKYHDSPLDELSGGELQRVFLARALVGSPRLLLLDEPGNFVDSAFEQGFYDKLRELNKSITIMMVSHDVGTISAYVKSFACVNKHLHYHDSRKITNEQLKGYGCPIQLIAHGDVPHTVLDKH
jgi:zinc transport system ATP-binding protein